MRAIPSTRIPGRQRCACPRSGRGAVLRSLEAHPRLFRTRAFAASADAAKENLRWELSALQASEAHARAAPPPLLTLPVVARAPQSTEGVAWAEALESWLADPTEPAPSPPDAAAGALECVGDATY